MTTTMALFSMALVLFCGIAGAEESRKQNPVTRVVELMQGLVKKVEADGKAEEELYDKYVCWYQTTVGAKKESNAHAKDQIESLNAFIDDVKSGRIEFTSERKDLEAEVAKLSADIESANAMRKKESEDYAAAKDEMEKAIAALEEAVSVLSAGTEGSALTSVGFGLRRAVKIGKSILSNDDVQFLERALDGEAGPDVDWKKLGDTSHQGKYKARSTKIQQILADMLQTFKDNLADATSKEDDAKKNFETLSASKESQLSAAQDGLAGGDAEGAARATNAAEAEDTVDALTTQVENDEKFIKQADDSYAVKATEWKERKRLRSGEVAAISKAISILTSDEARDLMSSSFKSQGALLLQSEGCSPEKRTAKAAAKLREVAVKHNDMRIAALAASARMTSRGAFEAIAESIDKMVSDLKAEYEEDLSKKNDCLDDRLSNTKAAKQAAQAMDDQTALISRQTALIEDKQKSVQDIVAHISELNLQMDEARVQRTKEAAEYAQSDADDKAAVKLIEKAAETLEKFYQDEALALVQVQRHTGSAQQPAGEAPPPPPSTWSKPYGGAMGETSGIQSIMAMVKEDVEKDIRAATEEEDKAKSDYETFNSETLSMISSLEAEKTKLEGEIGDAEDAIAQAKKTRGEKKNLMDDTLKVLRDIAPGCDFMAANFELRKANREAEIDGLYEAKASLQGGSFKFLQERC